jgi:hypothetical protein
MTRTWDATLHASRVAIQASSPVRSTCAAGCGPASASRPAAPSLSANGGGLHPRSMTASAAVPSCCSTPVSRVSLLPEAGRGWGPGGGRPGVCSSRFAKVRRQAMAGCPMALSWPFGAAADLVLALCRSCCSIDISLAGPRGLHLFFWSAPAVLPPCCSLRGDVAHAPQQWSDEVHAVLVGLHRQSPPLYDAVLVQDRLLEPCVAVVTEYSCGL